MSLARRSQVYLRVLKDRERSSRINFNVVVLRGMTYNAANGKEPNNDIDHFTQSFGIFSLDSIDRYIVKKVDSDIQVEHCRNPDWPEEAHEDGLPFFLDLMNELVHSKHNW